MPRIKSGSPEEQSELSQLVGQPNGDVNRPDTVNADLAPDDELERDAARRNENGAPPEH